MISRRRGGRDRSIQPVAAPGRGRCGGRETWEEYVTPSASDGLTRGRDAFIAVWPAQRVLLYLGLVAAGLVLWPRA
jgi:hypothetical protein